MSDESTAWTVAGKRALVTGASRGIGRAIAVQLASMGAKVACVATDAENCADTVSECLEHTEGARAFGMHAVHHRSAAETVEALRKLGLPA